MGWRPSLLGWRPSLVVLGWRLRGLPLGKDLHAYAGGWRQKLCRNPCSISLHQSCFESDQLLSHRKLHMNTSRSTPNSIDSVALLSTAMAYTNKNANYRVPKHCCPKDKFEKQKSFDIYCSVKRKKILGVLAWHRNS